MSRIKSKNNVEKKVEISRIKLKYNVKNKVKIHC